MPASDYKRHTNYDNKTNKELDSAWKEYIDYCDKLSDMDKSRKELLTGMNGAYEGYNTLLNEAIMRAYGEPLLNMGDKLLVTDGAWVIQSAIRYNKEFPSTKSVMPEVGDECVISNRIKLWANTGTVAVIKIDREEGGYWIPAWSNHHVPYKEVQKMRLAWLDKN